MNWLLLCRMLGLLGLLVGGSMVFSLPWAFPACGQTLETHLDDELIRFLLLRRLECRATFLRFRCRACG